MHLPMITVDCHTKVAWSYGKDKAWRRTGQGLNLSIRYYYVNLYNVLAL